MGYPLYPQLDLRQETRMDANAARLLIGIYSSTDRSLTVAHDSLSAMTRPLMIVEREFSRALGAGTSLDLGGWTGATHRSVERALQYHNTVSELLQKEIDGYIDQVRM